MHSVLDISYYAVVRDNLTSPPTNICISSDNITYHN